MRFTEHELTAALHGAAKSVLAAQRRDVRRGKVDLDTAWNEMDRLQRFTLLDGLGGQLLPVLTGLPDVEVEPGTRPTFTDEQITSVVEAQLGDSGGRMRRKVVLAARVALVKTALSHIPPRSDPDALTVPDHL
jgi:hypothetical protein